MAIGTPTTVNYVRRGTGEPLVLIHGLGHRWQAWQPVLDRLAEHHDVIAMDLPGFGASPLPRAVRPVDMPALTLSVAGFFGSLGLLRPHVAGNSLGGAIALELAAADQVASATALAPAGFCTAVEARRAIRVLRAIRATTFLPGPVVRATMRSPVARARVFGHVLAHPDRVSAAQAVEESRALRNAKAFRHIARRASGYRFTGTPTVPVTIGWGSQDRIFPSHQAAVARQLLPRARHVLLDGCGHVPMPDDPDRVATLILETTSAAGSDP